MGNIFVSILMRVFSFNLALCDFAVSATLVPYYCMHCHSEVANAPKQAWKACIRDLVNYRKNAISFVIKFF